jgi:hypothetical protein
MDTCEDGVQISDPIVLSISKYGVTCISDDDDDYDDDDDDDDDSVEELFLVVAIFFRYAFFLFRKRALTF